MPDVCTCGAKLPPDARFCHKCGKPQRDEPVFVEEVEETAPPPQAAVPVPVPARIGFHNLLAVRVALMAGALGLCLFVLLGQLPGLQVIAILSPVASGVFAVHLYKRKTGQRLSMASGAHLGWISGIFGFLITTLLFTAFAVMLTNPQVADAVRQQAGATRPEVMQALKEIQTTAGITKALLESFVFLTLLPTFGGSLGAKLLDRD
ncbi:MAG: zinc ribbon domain-containing protein [Acidobacteriota bacterium]|nr:zinc ribbon domain-containing protein [Acidobacteriota bacterium]